MLLFSPGTFRAVRGGVLFAFLASTASRRPNAGAGGKRARGAARGGGQEYWRKLYRDVDYGDQHDVARFHEIYGNVTRDEATFTEAAAAENLRGGPDAVARLCAWVAVHRSMRSCETRAPYPRRWVSSCRTRP